MAHKTPISDRSLAIVIHSSSQALWMFQKAAWRERWLFSSRQRSSHSPALDVVFIAYTNGKQPRYSHT
jgi:hypothetical protein